MNQLPPPFTHYDADTKVSKDWVPVSTHTTLLGDDVVVCTPGHVFFKREDCVNKTKQDGVVTFSGATA
jgi:hypothetical protein